MDLRYVSEISCWRRHLQQMANRKIENRGTRFVLSRDELLTLPEFVLLSLFPNGLFPEGHMSGFPDSDAVQVDVRKPEVSEQPISLYQVC